MSFFKSPWFAIGAAALGAALPEAAATFPKYATAIALVSMLLHGLTTQSAKVSPSPQEAKP